MKIRSSVRLDAASTRSVTTTASATTPSVNLHQTCVYIRDDRGISNSNRYGNPRESRWNGNRTPTWDWKGVGMNTSLNVVYFSDRQDVGALMCSVFIYLDLHY